MVQWKFKKDIELNSECDFYYDLTDGGYIKPEQIIEDAKQIADLNNAITLVRSFHDAYMEKAEEQAEEDEE